MGRGWKERRTSARLFDMTRMVVFLGNPGRQYERTRHNAGYLLCSRMYPDASFSVKFHSAYAKEDGLVILKPLTLMNLSGTAVSEAACFLRIKADEILVVHDDLELPLGEARLQKGGGMKGHNGLRSIRQRLGDDGFHRLRIGIGRPRERFQVSDWVLTTMKEEAPLWEEAMDSGVDVLSAFAKKGLERAVTLANRASKRIAEEAAKESEEKKA